MLGLAGMSGYFVFNKTNISSYEFPEFIRKKVAVDAAADKVLGAKIEEAKGLLPKLLDSVTEKGEEIIEKVENKIKEQVFKVFKDTINQKMETVGESFGVDIKQVAKPDSESPVVFGVKTGIPAYFSIQNREKASMRYEIDWDDSSKDGGKLEKGKEEVLSHKWEKPGDYLLKFKIIGKEEKIYNISITIL